MRGTVKYGNGIVKIDRFFRIKAKTLHKLLVMAKGKNKDSSEILWELFVTTGEPKYYRLYKDLNDGE